MTRGERIGLFAGLFGALGYAVDAFFWFGPPQACGAGRCGWPAATLAAIATVAIAAGLRWEVGWTLLGGPPILACGFFAAAIAGGGAVPAIVGAGLLVVQAVVVRSISNVKPAPRRRIDLATEGAPGVAVVLGYADGPPAPDGSQQALFRVRLDPIGSHVIAAATEAARPVPASARDTYRPGARLPVLYNPADRNHFDWIEQITPDSPPAAVIAWNAVHPHPLERLDRLHGLLRDGAITREEYEREKGRLLG